MGDLFDDAFDYDDASPDRQAVCRVMWANNEAMIRELERLRDVEAVSRRRWEALLPNRDALVLLALDEAGRDLDEAERVRLIDARPDLDRLRREIPATDAVVARMTADAADFDLCWGETFDASAPQSEPLRPARADDRTPVPHRRSLRRVAWRASFVFTLALIAVVSVLMLRREATETVLTAQAAKTLRFGDGTLVRLRPGATLAYAKPSQGSTRTVRLTGNAVFEVVHTGAPFTVETPSGRVVVTGTVFGVRATRDETQVTLVEGRVMLAPKDAATGVTLAPGQQSRVVPGALPTTPSDVDIADEMAWSGRFYFHDTPLRVAAERLTSHYRTTVLVDGRLADERVNGEFDDTTPLPEILRILASTLPSAQVDTVEDGFRLR